MRRYGWNGNLKISILTNFTDLLIYDCSIRPVETDETNVALVAHYHYTEYASKFDELYNLISRDAVISGNFDRQFSSISSTLKKEPFDSYFLSQIKNWRNVLSLDIVQHNNVVNDDDLNIFVQRILNRIIFLRICEDRNFEEYETIKRITTYSHLKELFKSADNKYDSGLFDLIDDGDIVVVSTK